jgi:hypothetical protein
MHSVSRSLVVTVFFSATQLQRVSLEYARTLNELEEKKRFMFVEYLLSYTFSYRSFLHHVRMPARPAGLQLISLCKAYEVLHEQEPFMQAVTQRLQNMRDTFDTQKEMVDELMRKSVATAEGSTQVLFGVPIATLTPDTVIELPETMEGSLFIQRRGVVGMTWSAVYCRYSRESRELSVTGAPAAARLPPSETHVVSKVRVVAVDEVDRRNVFEAQCGVDKVFLLQAPTRFEYDSWVCMLTLGEVIPSLQPASTTTSTTTLERAGSVRVSTKLRGRLKMHRKASVEQQRDMGDFIPLCIMEIERRGEYVCMYVMMMMMMMMMMMVMMMPCVPFTTSRAGLDTEGLYRLPGSKVRVQSLLDRYRERKSFNMTEEDTLTICSALKQVRAVGIVVWSCSSCRSPVQYFREMKEPIMTFFLHEDIIESMRTLRETIAFCAAVFTRRESRCRCAR